MSEPIRIQGISAHLQTALEAEGFAFSKGPSVFEGGHWWLVKFESAGRKYSAWVPQDSDGVFHAESSVKAYHPVRVKESRTSKNAEAVAKVRALVDRLNGVEVAA